MRKLRDRQLLARPRRAESALPYGRASAPYPDQVIVLGPFAQHHHLTIDKLANRDRLARIITRTLFTATPPPCTRRLASPFEGARPDSTSASPSVNPSAFQAWTYPKFRRRHIGKDVEDLIHAQTADLFAEQNFRGAHGFVQFRFSVQHCRDFARQPALSFALVGRGSTLCSNPRFPPSSTR